MNIFFQGMYTSEEAAETFLSLLRLFKERYYINQFREMHLTVTLVDNNGNDVELVDSDTAYVHRTFNIHHTSRELIPGRSQRPLLELVVDNTR